MHRELRLFFTALIFLTRIPCARWAGSSEDDLSHAARYFSLVGLVVGLVAAAVFWLAVLVFPQGIAIIASMVATLWLTGAFHEDGLADAMDGLGGGWSKEQVLTIMKDSRIGTYGAVALVMSLLIKFTVLSALPAQRISTGELGVAGLFGLAPLALLPLHWLWGLLPVALVWLWFSHKLKQRLGGYTGDCLGAMQQLCELTFYLGVLACGSI